MCLKCKDEIKRMYIILLKYILYTLAGLTREESLRKGQAVNTVEGKEHSRTHYSLQECNVDDRETRGDEGER